MKITDSVKTCFAKYASFQGTASRSEYWKFVFFCMLVGSAANLSKSLPLYLFVVLVLMLPSTAVLVRRLHDTNHSGMWYFLVFTVVGVIPLFIWLCSPTVDEDNKYSLSKSRKKCPDCAEYVAIDAKKCKHCGASLTVDAEHCQIREASQKKSEIDWGFICLLPIGLAVIAYDAYDTNSELQKSISNNNSSNVSLNKNLSSTRGGVSDGEGNQYSYKVDNSKFELTSSNHKIVLSEDCKAKSSQFGIGTWEQSNGGFLIQFSTKKIGFPRQEVLLDNITKCLMQ